MTRSKPRWRSELRSWRFLALVRKYEDITEVTNEMLYAFIEKILVHAPTGGRSAQRRQQIDVYFSFIGTFVPPGAEEEEEAKRAEQEQQLASVISSSSSSSRSFHSGWSKSSVSYSTCRLYLERQAFHSKIPTNFSREDR